MRFSFQSVGFALLLTILTFISMPQMYWLSLAGFFVFYFSILQLLQGLGQGFPVRPLIALMAALQLVVGTSVQFNVYNDDVIFFMPITEKEYMDYAVPALLAFVAGLYFRTPRAVRQEMGMLQNMLQEGAFYRKTGFFLLYVGIFGTLASPFVPASLKFLAYLLSNVKIVGAYYIYLSRDKNRYLWLGLGFSTLMVDALRSGLFHDLLLWGIFSAVVIFFVLKPTVSRKSTLLITATLAVFTLQTIKADYREVIASDKGLGFFSRLSVLVQLYAERLGDAGSLTKTETRDFGTTGLKYYDSPLANATARANQGRIVGLIMVHVPRNEPYAQGETITNALYASFLPRFLAPNKIKAGGHAYYERFTGIPLPRTVSMDLGLLGEGYANFGVTGGIIFMFFIGYFFNRVLVFLFKKTRKYPTLPLWIPFIFLYAVKAEVDLATILNQMTKSGIVVFGFFVFMSGYFKRKRRALPAPVSVPPRATVPA